ncbi:MAG: flippase [Chloroflexi bacterium]|nr:flippase [Chloroflexota bacterium]
MVRNIIKNVIALSVNGGIRIVFGMIIQVLIGRLLGAESLGKFAVMTAYIAIFQVVMQLGLPNLLIRETARHRDEASRYWWSTVVVLVLAGAVAWGVQSLVAFLWGHPPDTYAMVVVSGISLIPFGVVIASEATLRGLERMEIIPLVQTIAYTLYTLAVLVAVMLHLSVVALGWAMVLLQTVGAILYLLYLARAHVVQRVWIDLGLTRHLLRLAPHFYGLPVAAIIPNRIAIIIIAKILGEEASGIFNAAQVLARSLFFISTGYSEALYPALSRLFLQGWDRFRRGVRLGIQYGLVFSAVLSLGMMAWAPWLVDWVFGLTEYAGAVPLLRILVWQAVLFVLNGVLGVVEMAANRQDLTFYIAIAKVIAFLVIIPIFTYVGGLTGAALGILVSSGSSVILHIWAVHRVTRGVPPWHVWARAGVVIAGSVAVAQVLQHTPLWIAGTVPVLVYAMGLLLLRLVQWSDIRTVTAQFMPGG